MIEGSDPELKHVMVMFIAHFDHVGTGEEGVFNGADDNASGTVALLEIAEAFLAERKMPGRSIGFLWVSGEEIGLYGSAYFADHPMVPLDDVAAVINMDMVGRVALPEDLESDRKSLTIVGRDSVKIIGGKQSSLLMQINEETLEDMGLIGNYEYNDINHPERYYYRSDHISFARKDIPVLFYSTGTHADYHMVTDDPGKIAYDKFRHMTAFCFMVGYNVADHNGEITVDNPMSEW
jgi:Zn-dependent M28 family amino/carboxypeptidase